MLHHDVSEEDRAKFCGRAGGCDFSWSRSRSTPGRAHLRDQHLEWWELRTALIRRYVLLHRAGKDQELDLCA
eukprot:7925152-Pyramimonas_sp.AAC.1